MRKLKAILLVGLVCSLLFTGCASKQVYQDGVYTAEFANYDSRSFKDFIQITVSNGTITNVVYDSKDPDGNLKSKNADYAKAMEAVQATYPEQFIAGLTNQLMETKSIAKIDAVAGATYSSDSFVALFQALEKSIFAGDTTLVIVDNITEQ